MSQTPSIIVDDDRPVRATLSEIVTRAGYTALQASSAVKAIDTLERNDVHLVLLDIYMPGATGMDMLQALKRRRISVPIVVVSGFVSDVMARQLIDLGVCGILAKPFRAERVLEEIRSFAMAPPGIASDPLEPAAPPVPCVSPGG